MRNPKIEHIVLFFLTFFMFIPELYAIDPNISPEPQFVEVNESIGAFKNGWKGLADIVIGMFMFIGIISIVRAFGAGAEYANKLLYSWFTALIVWRVAFAIF